jgi:hypothetical protein
MIACLVILSSDLSHCSYGIPDGNRCALFTETTLWAGAVDAGRDKRALSGYRPPTIDIDYRRGSPEAERQ